MTPAEQQVIATVPRTTRIPCPFCSHERKKKNDKCLSITVFPDRRVWDCHHCGEKGALPNEDPLDRHLHPPKPEVKVAQIPTKLNRNQEAIREYFKQRGVNLDDMSGLPAMVTGQKYFHKLEMKVPAIGFIYGDPKQPEAIKWRPLKAKAFTQDGTAKSFYGIRELPENPKEIIIVEGEADVIALASVGVKAVSVPNGAPLKVSADGRIRPEDDKKFGYIWEARELLDKAERIVLAVDGDEQGGALAEEIARRVGRAKCWRTQYPDTCKDMTDVLREHGSQAVADALNNAEAMPLQGVYSADDYTEALLDLYQNGIGRGTSTGLPSIDELFTIKEGMLTVVTGIPGNGKSEFIDQIMVNLAVNEDWKFAICSFENPPEMHIAKLSEKIVRKPFYEGVTPRMKKQELEKAKKFINEHFVFLESRSGDLESVDSIIDRTKQAVMRLGIRGLVIDPYNYIQRDKNTTETEFITHMLTKIVAFCKAAGVHVWFVAHPAKMYRREDGSYPVPKGMDIGGSAAWFSKPDIGITVHRGPDGVEIHCWKVRFKWLGEVGMRYLDYDVPTGIYSDMKQPFSGFGVPTDKLNGKAAPHWLDAVEKDAADL